MSRICFDLETTVNGGPNGDSPEAHWLNNEVLMSGWSENGGPINVHKDGLDPWMEDAIAHNITTYGAVTLVAHNAKFDIKYLMREWPDIKWEAVDVWDTMTWEYLHSGHLDKFVSLEDALKKHNIQTTGKTMDLAAILASGLKMEDIPKDDLAEYLRVDVDLLNTLTVKQQSTTHYDMTYILPLAEMELNGLLLDQQHTSEERSALLTVITSLETNMRTYIQHYCEWQDGSDVKFEDFSESLGIKSKTIKPFANRTISFLLFGEPGELKITNKWRLRHRTNPHFSPAVAAKYYPGVEPTHVGYPVDEKKLEEIFKGYHGTSIIRDILEWRKANKLVGTYYSPFLETAKIQGTIHPKLNTTATATGRLSSSEPNGQNMPEEARRCIVARPGYELEELDFSQLEMVAAAAVSGCQALIEDLNHGVDIHYNTAADVFGADQAEAKRKLAKNVNFGVLYGGKAPGLSRQTGVDQDTIKELIRAFFTKYPRIKEWHEEVFNEVLDNMQPYDIKDGEQRYKSTWALPNTKRRFTFVESSAPDWLRKRIGRGLSFSPNHTANYPLQGFAGGEIVLTALSYLWHDMRAECLDVRYLMTVHDSILIEKPIGLDLSKYYDTACRDTQVSFNLPVTLEYDVVTGNTWS